MDYKKRPFLKFKLSLKAKSMLTSTVKLDIKLRVKVRAKWLSYILGAIKDVTLRIKKLLGLHVFCNTNNLNKFDRKTNLRFVKFRRFVKILKYRK